MTLMDAPLEAKFSLRKGPGIRSPRSVAATKELPDAERPP